MQKTQPQSQSKPQAKPKPQPQRAIALNGLRGFEAAARHLSLTDAAHELHLSQSALSRQVAGLENALGYALFIRRAREIVLTPSGEAFVHVVRKALQDIDRAVEIGRRRVSSSLVSVTTFASFASMWLIPRLGSLRFVAPELVLDLAASDRVVDIEAEGVDVAIRYMAHEFAPASAMRLMEEHLFPLASAEYLASHPPIRSARDLRGHALIEAVGTGPGEARNSWPAFFASQGLAEIEVQPALRLDFIMQAFLAARRGHGLAMAHTYGADQYMEGELVRALDVTVRPDAGTYCIVNPNSTERPEVKAFLRWLASEAATFNAALSQWLANPPLTRK